MLTAEHVRVRLVEGELRPGWVKPDDPKVRERAEELVGLFRESVGRSRAEIEESLDALVGAATDAKLVGGLAKLLFDRAEFDVAAPLPPAELRELVFRAAAKLGPPGLWLGPMPGAEGEAAGPARPDAPAPLDEPVPLDDAAPGDAGGAVPDRNDAVWAAVAAQLGQPVGALRGALYADHADEQRLVAIDVPSAEWLLHRYNVALVQAVLLRATELRLHLDAPTPARARSLARAAKFHQLVFQLAPEATGGFSFTVDGPASLFAHTTRYGLALAKFFPAILLETQPWSLEADVVWSNRRVRLRLDHTKGLRSHYRDLGSYETREARWFAERFEALGSGWRLLREPVALLQGTEGVVVPDFGFEKEGRVAWLEILGFWRKGTVPRRVALLRRHGPKNLVLAVSRRLCAAEEEALPEQVVPFAEVIPAKEVLARVEEIAVRR